jgi:transposase-like protein
VPRDREGEFVTEVFERYKRMTGDAEEAVLEMCLSGISVRNSPKCALREDASLRGVSPIRAPQHTIPNPGKIRKIFAMASKSLEGGP